MGDFAKIFALVVRMEETEFGVESVEFVLRVVEIGQWLDRKRHWLHGGGGETGAVARDQARQRAAPRCALDEPVFREKATKGNVEVVGNVAGAIFGDRGDGEADGNRAMG